MNMSQTKPHLEKKNLEQSQSLLETANGNPYRPMISGSLPDRRVRILVSTKAHRVLQDRVWAASHEHLRKFLLSVRHASEF